MFSCSDKELLILPKNGKPAEKLVIVMHGYGADGRDLFSLGKTIHGKIANVEIHVPNGFEGCEGGGNGYQWFSLQCNDYAHEIEKASAKLIGCLHDLLSKKNLTSKDLALVGFSQGGMMALHVGLTMEAIAIVSFSGQLVDPVVLKRSKNTARVFIAHGELDSVIPISAFRETKIALEKNGHFVQAISVPGMGHSTDNKCVDLACDFIKSAFSAEK